jgi:hypothetical protein
VCTCVCCIDVPDTCGAAWPLRREFGLNGGAETGRLRDRRELGAAAAVAAAVGVRIEVPGSSSSSVNKTITGNSQPGLAVGRKPTRAALCAASGGRG